MKTKLFFWFTFIALIVPGFLRAQEVQVGGGTEINTHLPIEPYYGYSYSQQIYLASEIGDTDGGTITAIKFYYHGNGISHSNDWTVYIGHTTKTEFTSNTDWVPVSSMTQVFSGNIGTVSADGWVTIDINDWTYNGTDNIVVAVDENQSSYDSSGDDFYCTAVSNNRAIEYHNDSTNPDPANPPTASSGNPKAFVPNIIFVGLQAVCGTPTSATATPTSETEATLSWNANGASQWELEWGPAGFTQGSGTTVTGITQPSYQLTGLTVGDYDYYVRADCGGGTYSNWAGPISWTQTHGNNDCANALNLTVYPEGGGSGNEITQNTNFSTPSSMSQTSCDSYGDNYDLFYSFTAPSTGAIKVITGGTKGDNVEAAVYDSCGGTDFACFDQSNTKTVSGLTPGNNYILQIWHDSGNRGEFTIVLEETCPAPTGLAASPTSESEATLSWDANGGSQWDLEWGPAGFTQGSGTMVTALSQPTYQLTGLSGGTAYDYYVRTDCGGGSYSDWVGPFSWTQLPSNDDCAHATEVASLPYHDSLDASGATNNAGFISICSNAMNDGVWYKFTVDQVNGDITVTADPDGWDPQLDVYEGTDCASLTCVQAEDAHGSGTAESITFTPTAGSTYYVNVGYYSGNTDRPEGPFTLDISGNVTLKQHNPEFQNFVLYPNPTHGRVSWNTSKHVQSVSVMDPGGKELFRINEPGNGVDLHRLAAGTYILNIRIQGVNQSFVIVKD